MGPSAAGFAETGSASFRKAVDCELISPSVVLEKSRYRELRTRP
jgi:hypothetical protein